MSRALFGEIDNRYILEADKVLHLSRGESRLRLDRLLQTAVLVTGALAMLAASYAAGAAGLLAPVLPEETKGA